jgi:hypothetical protein
VAHNGWDEERHLTVWTSKRCGATKVNSNEIGHPRMMDPGGDIAGIWKNAAHINRQQTSSSRHACMRLPSASVAKRHEEGKQVNGGTT